MRCLQALAFLVAAAANTSAATRDVPAKVTGRVEDIMGATISDAYVLIHPGPVGDTGPAFLVDKNFATDRNGYFSIEVLRGVCDVCVMAMAFDAQCRKIHVADQRQLQLKFQLKGKLSRHEDDRRPRLLISVRYHQRTDDRHRTSK